MNPMFVTGRKIFAGQKQMSVAMLSIHSSPIGELGTSDTGGMSVYIRELARHLGAIGHRIDIFTSLRNGHAEQLIQLHDNVRLIHLGQAGNGVPHHGASLYPHLDDYLTALRCFQERLDLHYHLIFSHYWLSGLIGSRLQQLWKVPHLTMFHTLGAVKNRLGIEEREPQVRIRSEKQIAECCDRIVVAAEREKSHLVRHYRVPEEKIAVIPCGVDLDLFSPGDRARARLELGLADDRQILLYVGRFARLKGLDRLLDALPLVRSSGPPPLLLIIGGDGPDAPESRALLDRARDLGIAERVSFAGRVPHEQLPPYYRAADLVVIPSLYESFGLVALEALASGTRIVTTRVGAMERIVRHGETGWVAAGACPESLTRGIEELLAQPDLARPTPDRVRATVARYAWSRIAEEIHRLFHKVCEDCAVPGLPRRCPSGPSMPVESLWLH